MTIREQVIRKSIKLCMKKIAELDAIMNSRPWLEKMEFVKRFNAEVNRLMDDKKINEAKLYCIEAQKEAIRIDKLIEKQKDYIGLCNKQETLNRELFELQHELRFIVKS